MSRTLIAMFDHRVEAEATRARLVAAAIAPGRIGIHAGGASAPAADGTGLWTEMLGLLVPEEDRQVVHEGVRRGGTLLTVEVEDDQADAAAGIIDAAHPVDLHVRKAAWQAAPAGRWDDEEED
jgi:hypothetical protein